MPGKLEEWHQEANLVLDAGDGDGVGGVGLEEPIDASRRQDAEQGRLSNNDDVAGRRDVRKVVTLQNGGHLTADADLKTFGG